ncbi:MAG TPA: tetratricopeptide repeat protein [Blastocatellia bacterium]|jgi:tetratricopeptide (TPR) repeat protein|nr:tetratricopeptide repeat protein [Blastocatellia bacterium]
MVEQRSTAETPQEQKAATVAGNLLMANARFIVPAIVLAVTFLGYVGTLRYDFVYDDVHVIVENGSVHSWRFMPRYFTEHLWFFEPGMTNYYRPIFLVWLVLNHTLFGLNPIGYHLTTVLVHVVVTLLVFHLTRRLTGDQATAAIASLLFGLHPAHIEGVAWVSGVSEPLLALFLIGSFLCYLRYRALDDGKGRGWLMAALALAALAVFEKETGIVLPLMIFAYELIFNAGREGRSSRGEDNARPDARSAPMRHLGKALGRCLPFVAVTVLYLIARVIALGAIGRTKTPLSLATLVFTWPSLLLAYVKILAWPVGLSAFYDTPYVVRPGLLNFYLPLVAIAAAGCATWWLVRRTPAGRLALVWLILPIMPLLNLTVFGPGELVHDRYMYLPSVGFVLIVALTVRRLRVGGSVLFGLPAVQILTAMILACASGVALANQNIHWSSNLTLFHHSLEIAPNSKTAKGMLAEALVVRGMYVDGARLFQELLDQDPGSSELNHNMGFALNAAGKPQEAEPYLMRAIEIKPLQPDAHYLLGVVRLTMNRLDEAESPFREAVRISPNVAFYHYGLGSWFKMRGELREALREFELELVNNPNFAMAQDQITDIKARLGSANDSAPAARSDQVRTIQ